MGSFITVVVILIICAAPFVGIAISQQKKRRRILDALAAAAGVPVKKLDYELLHHVAIGLNAASAQVYYIKLLPTGNLSAAEVRLTDVKNCELRRDLRKESGYISSLTGVYLVFKYKSNMQATEFEIYNIANDSPVVRGEEDLAARWESKINAIVKV